MVRCYDVNEKKSVGHLHSNTAKCGKITNYPPQPQVVAVPAGK